MDHLQLVPKTQKLKMGDKEKELRLLSDNELENHELIGTADGDDLGHCLYLGMRYSKNFFKRVVGYISREPEKCNVCIDFYEKKQAETKEEKCEKLE